MNKDKIIKDLKKRNDKLKNQNELKDIRCCHLEQENQKLKNNKIKAVSDYETTMAENNLLKKQLKKYNNIKEMFEIGVVDLEKLKNIVLGNEK